MTRLLFQEDSYLREFKARVTQVLDMGVVLDQTAFNPVGGGLVSDTGVLEAGGRVYRVAEVRKDRETGSVVHYLDRVEGLSVGDEVRGVIDWERRYRIMRMHTGLHMLIAVLNRKTGVLVTGNQVKPDRSRVDVNLEKPDPQLVAEAFEEANRLLAEGRPVKVYFLPREEAMKIPGIVKLAKAMPPSIEVLRIVEIEGIDIQADGGPHVANTREVGRLVFLKLENKGKNNRRIYFTLEDAGAT